MRTPLRCALVSLLVPFALSVAACDDDGEEPLAAGAAGGAGTSSAGGSGGAAGAGGAAAGSGGGAGASAGSGGEAGGAGASGAAGSAGAIAFEELRSSVPYDTTPDIDAAEQAIFVGNNNAFAFDLYGEVAAYPALGGKNVFLSPLSVSYALGMTSAGAKGETLTQIQKALHFTLPSPTTHAGFNWLDAELASRPAEALATLAPERRAKTTMDWNLVNTLFLQKGYPAEAAFLDTLSESYDAGVKLEEFIADPDGARQRINAWVAGETSERIQDLLPPGSITTDVKFVLVNAISMGAPWATPFAPELTQDGPFTRLDGSQVTIPMMRHPEAMPFPYVATAEVEAAAFPLLGHALEVVIAMPKGGSLAELEASMAGGGLDAIRGAMAPEQLEARLPKFKLTTDSVSLVPAMKELGMTTAFTAMADLSGISTATELRIFDILHKAMVGFDEKGIEAAAATAVIGGDTSVPPPGTPFVVDRPFLLGIRDATTGALLFWGRVVDPS